MKSLRYFLLAILGVATLCIVWYLTQFPYTIAPFINPILMMLIPLALGIFLARRLGGSWRLYGLGAATFIGSQVLHIPFNQWTLNPIIQNLGLESTPGSLDLAIVGLLAGLSAGVFEETARYLVYQRWAKEARSWSQGLMFGAGHGASEAIILGVVALAGFLQMLTLRGGLEGLGIPSDQIEAVQASVSAYWGTPWYIFFLSTVERVAAITFHMTAALMVLRAIRHSNILWYFAAILGHTIFNATAVFANVTWGPLVAEGLIVLMAVGFVGLIFWLREEDSEETEDMEAVDTEAVDTGLPEPPASDLETSAPEITSEHIEDSRYDG